MLSHHTLDELDMILLGAVLANNCPRIHQSIATWNHHGSMACSLWFESVHNNNIAVVNTFNG